MVVHWQPAPDTITGVVFTDGSAANPACKDIRVARWSVVQLDGLELKLSASALLPTEIMPDHTVPVAELFAAVYAAEHSTGPIAVGIDCENIIKGVQTAVLAMAQALGVPAHLWPRF
eukprot:126398-Amphidinium_carterae.1